MTVVAATASINAASAASFATQESALVSINVRPLLPRGLSYYRGPCARKQPRVATDLCIRRHLAASARAGAAARVALLLRARALGVVRRVSVHVPVLADSERALRPDHARRRGVQPRVHVVRAPGVRRGAAFFADCERLARRGLAARSREPAVRALASRADGADAGSDDGRHAAVRALSAR